MVVGQEDGGRTERDDCIGKSLSPHAKSVVF